MSSALSCILLIFFTFASGPASWGQVKKSQPLNTHLYLSVSDRHTILHYIQDPKSGSLSLTDSVMVPGTCGSLSVSPSRAFMYAAIRSEKSIATLHINPNNGELKYGSLIKAAGNPVYLSCDHTGKFLFSAYYSDNQAAVYRILHSGELKPEAIQILDLPPKPHYIRIDRSNRYVFVPVLGADMIRQYIFHPSASDPLQTNHPEKIMTAGGSGPRHLAFHPYLPYCYGVNELNSTISVYFLDENTGLLKLNQTMSNLPSGYHGENTCADVHITPDGKYVYASNRGHNSIAAYRVNKQDGRLVPLGYFPTEKKPREFDIDLAGKYLYAAGQDSGGLAAYRIEPSGKLSLLKVYQPGGELTWVEMISIRKNFTH